MTRTFSLTAVVLISLVQLSAAQDPTKFKIHDLNRPLPPVITSGTASTQDAPGRAPSDAVVLFDGKDLSHWTDKDGKTAMWKVENGYVEVAAGSGYIATRDSFGDCQLHVEFAEPSPGVGESQQRGNSGVFLMSQYEIQVLDSYENKTYADGQAAAVYGQYPPLVNASRPPAQWQTYDIIFHRAHFKDGKVTSRARVTVLHNGVLVQDNVELTGPTAHGERPPYKPGPDKLPLQLQDHSYPVRFRNIWIRELHE
jgi:membrane-bound lytic murein transglycosylase